nr:helix-turn-helix domain-containing protein [Deltaproteobacteria bacterium]
ALVNVLGAFGQGKTRRAACDMLARVILEVAAEHRPLDGFKVTVVDDGEGTIYVTSNDPVRLTAMLLRCQREEREMSLADVAQRMGGAARSAYAQYEQGRREPSIGKLQELLAAVAPELTLAIIPRTARVIPRHEAVDDDQEMEALLRDPIPANAAAFRAKGRTKARHTG